MLSFKLISKHHGLNPRLPIIKIAVVVGVLDYRFNYLKIELYVFGAMSKTS